MNKSAIARQGGLARIERYGNPGTPEGRSRGGMHSLKIHQTHDTGFKVLKHIQQPPTSIELAELLGIFAGDGHVGEYQMSVTTHSETDIEHARYTAQLIEKVFGMVPTLSYREKQKAVVVTLSSKEACRHLVKRGAVFGDKIRGGIQMPAWVRSRLAYRAAYVRGLFDTDGSVYVDKHIVRGRTYENIAMIFSNKSLQLLADFKNDLESRKLRPTQKTEFAVFLRREEDIRAYFATIGSSNPKHTRKVSDFFSKKGGVA